ncbi:hypothetical protein GCM10007937_36330 [Mesorhizobium albiziae]|nr:hypothetical protein GCM10007937_36330 [Mesorhizobium albiziae]
MAYDVPEKGALYGVWSIQSLWAPLFPTELEDTIGFSTSLPQGEAILISPELMPPPIGYEAFQEHIETAVLPFLRSVDSLERFYRVAARQANPVTPHSNFCLELAMGNFDGASKLMARQRNDWFQKQDDYFDEDEFEQIRQLCHLLDDANYGAIARTLHEWEALTAEHSNLEKIWEPSPFPFEPGYDDWLRRSRGKPG